MKFHFPIALAMLAASALPAHAVLVTDAGAITGPSTIVDFEAFDGLLTNGPEVVSINPLVVFTGDSGAELGANNRDLGSNGLWGVGNHFAASGVAGELRFTFTAGTASAGAFLNHFAFQPHLLLSLEVSAYGQNNQIIETHNFTYSGDSGDYNLGQFLGISRAQADIRSIAFKGVGVVADDLTFTTPVPEPASWALLAAGIMALGFLRQRRPSN